MVDGRCVRGVECEYFCNLSIDRPMNPTLSYVPTHNAPGWPLNPNAGQGDSSLTATLIVKHLPEAIPQETLSRLFSHYGASAVRPCSGGRLRNCAFVDFKNDALAYQAQRQLNGLRFLNKVLKVERASDFSKDKKIEAREGPLPKDVSLSSMQKEVLLSHDRNESLKPRSYHASEPIAPKLGVDYPFPPHLEYAYPPPDGNILTNIVNALIAVPRFYTQVLHLMNKMNIPAPFRMALPTPPLPASAPPPPLSAVTKSSPADMSNSESELESSEEEAGNNASSLKAKSGRKRPRKEYILGPAVDKDVAHESVGVKPAALVPKEIPMIKKKNPVLQINIAQKIPKTQPIDDHEMNNPEETEKDTSDVKPYATPDELEKGRLPPEEILSLPMFKNYTAGNPAPVLYIKNLAKDVVVEDFFYIFGSLFGNFDEAMSSINVKLMQEGRMRGQAFVTFPSVELAHHALNLVNGYVFKDKPMIIQFGRNPSAAKAT